MKIKLDQEDNFLAMRSGREIVVHVRGTVLGHTFPRGCLVMDKHKAAELLVALGRALDMRCYSQQVRPPVAEAVCDDGA